MLATFVQLAKLTHLVQFDKFFINYRNFAINTTSILVTVNYEEALKFYYVQLQICEE